MAGWMRFVLAALAVGGFVGILTYAFTRDERYMRTLVPAERAPSFILTLFDGKVIAIGTPSEVQSHPEVQRAYLGD